MPKPETWSDADERWVQESFATIIDRAEFDAGDRQERDAGVTGLVLLQGLLEMGYVPPHMVSSVRRVLRQRDEGVARYERAMRDPMLARAPV